MVLLRTLRPFKFILFFRRLHNSFAFWCSQVMSCFVFCTFAFCMCELLTYYLLMPMVEYCCCCKRNKTTSEALNFFRIFFCSCFAPPNLIISFFCIFVSSDVCRCCCDLNGLHYYLAVFLFLDRITRKQKIYYIFYALEIYVEQTLELQKPDKRKLHTDIRHWKIGSDRF